MKDRKFGVELEFGFRGGYTAAESLLADAAERGDCSWHWVREMHQDGTLCEAKSAPLSGRAGFAELHRVMNLIRSNGGYITQADGMHVHHDAPDFIDDIEAVIRLVKSWVAMRPQIEKLVRAERRNYGACLPWSTADVKLLEVFAEDPKARETKVDQGLLPAVASRNDFKDANWSRRDLNIASLSVHGTIEVRLHQGCLDPRRAEAWIRLCQGLLNKAATIKNPVEAPKNKAELLRVLRAAKISQEVYA